MTTQESMERELVTIADQLARQAQQLADALREARTSVMALAARQHIHGGPAERDKETRLAQLIAAILAVSGPDVVRGQLNRRSVHSLLALADILERDEAAGLTHRQDGKIYVDTLVLRRLAAELPAAWQGLETARAQLATQGGEA